MVEVNPPQFMDGQCYTWSDFRHVFQSIVCDAGVVETDDLLVTAAGGASVNVNVSAGSAWIEGSINGAQGMYLVTNGASKPVTIAANGAGAARIDLIVASVYDSQYIGGVDQWALEVVQGVAGGGVPAVPDLTRSGYVILGEVTVPASGGTPSVVEDVRDRMQMCGGDWQDFVPDIQGVTADVVLARYNSGNNVITANYELILTSDPTSVVEIGLPVPIREGNVNFYNPGSGMVLYQGTNYYQAAIQTVSEDYFRFYWSASGDSEIVPLTSGQGWLTNDRLFCTITYEPKVV